MTSMFIYSKEVKGGTFESIRDELYGVICWVEYRSRATKGERLPEVPYYFDILKAIHFEKSPYIRRTPANADGRNIDTKIRLRDILNNIENTVQLQEEKKCKFEVLSFPSKLYVICDKASQRCLEYSGSVSMAMQSRVTSNFASTITENETVTAEFRKFLSNKGTEVYCGVT